MNNLSNTTIHEAFIIDDEMDICFLLSKLLKQKEISSDCAYTIQQAEIALKDKEPEIIFLDNHLPDGKGIGFIKKIKKDHPSSKIIMITAHDNQADREMALKAGADYFISKPFSIGLINQTLESIVA